MHKSYVVLSACFICFNLSCCFYEPGSLWEIERVSLIPWVIFYDNVSIFWFSGISAAIKHNLVKREKKEKEHAIKISNIIGPLI